MKSAQERTSGKPGHTHVSDPQSHDCRAVSGILSRSGDKWSVLIISRLGEGPRRFNEIKRIIGGISQRMLTLTLRQLKQDGLLARAAYAEVPPRVESSLSRSVVACTTSSTSLIGWAAEHHDEIRENRARASAATTTNS